MGSSRHVGASPMPRPLPAGRPAPSTSSSSPRPLGRRGGGTGRSRRSARRREPRPGGCGKAQQLAQPLAGRPTERNWSGTSSVSCSPTRCAQSSRYADVVESVDRMKLVGGLSRAVAAGRSPDHPVRCLVQVCLDDQPGRGGALPADVAAIADEIAAAPGLELGGVMAVAPLGADPDRAFARLQTVAERGGRCPSRRRRRCRRE